MKLFIAILLLLFSMTTTAGAAGNMTVISPPDGASVESDLLSVVVRLENKNFDDIRLAVGAREQNLAKKPMDKFYVCFAGVRLAPGENHLKLSALKEGKKVEEINFRVFFRSDLSATANATPAEYSSYYFHTRDNEKECTPCHNLDFTHATDDVPSPDKSPCYLCHKQLTANYRLAHGPAAVWSCPVCHDVRAKGGRKLAVVDPPEKVCVSCHENDWHKKKFMHGPTAAGSCTACHNPHAADQPSFLRLKTADLCISCHEDTASKPHLISGFSGNAGHPIRRSPDPFNPNRDFSCASCHNPHATDYPVLLNSDNSSMFLFCQSCHKM